MLFGPLRVGNFLRHIFVTFSRSHNGGPPNSRGSCLEWSLFMTCSWPHSIMLHLRTAPFPNVYQWHYSLHSRNTSVPQHCSSLWTPGPICGTVKWLYRLFWILWDMCQKCTTKDVPPCYVHNSCSIFQFASFCIHPPSSYFFNKIRFSTQHFLRFVAQHFVVCIAKFVSLLHWTNLDPMQKFGWNNNIHYIKKHILRLFRHIILTHHPAKTYRLA